MSYTIKQCGNCYNYIPQTHQCQHTLKEMDESEYCEKYSPELKWGLDTMIFLNINKELKKKNVRT